MSPVPARNSAAALPCGAPVFDRILYSPGRHATSARRLAIMTNIGRPHAIF